MLAKELGFALKEHKVEIALPDQTLTEPERAFKIQFVRKLNEAFANGRPFETFQLFLEQALDAVAPKKILLMLDEFDHIHVGIKS